MTSVTCDVPVVARDGWVGREARPQFYREHRYVLSSDPVFRSLLPPSFPNLFCTDPY